MTKWTFTHTDRDGNTSADTVTRDEGFVEAMAQATAKRGSRTQRDGEGRITAATINHSGGTGTYQRQ